MNRLSLPPVFGAALLLVGCESTHETVSQTAGAAAEQGKAAVDLAKRAGDQAEALTKETEKAATKALADVSEVGDLSAATKEWLAKGTDAAGRSIEAVVGAGAQLAPVALQIGKVLDQAVDREISIEPIFQRLDDASAQARTDTAIGEMPRVEVIDGLQVGFKRVSELDVHRHKTESAYLVVWRKSDHLVGFVYRSRREIDIERLVAETPRLVRLVLAALESSDATTRP
jgi:hypothetical protein